MKRIAVLVGLALGGCAAPQPAPSYVQTVIEPGATAPSPAGVAWTPENTAAYYSAAGQCRQAGLTEADPRWRGCMYAFVKQALDANLARRMPY